MHRKRSQDLGKRNRRLWSDDVPVPTLVKVRERMLLRLNFERTWKSIVEVLVTGHGGIDRNLHTSGCEESFHF